VQDTRKARLASVIQQELSLAVRSIKDPRVPSVTFTSVEVAQDGSQATVYVMVLGGSGSLGDHSDRAAIRDALEGLKSASGYLRRHLAKILTVRHIPSLIFKEDKGLANVSRVHELLKEVETRDKAAAGKPEPDSAD
jgi:ribosome-binding factor A